MSTKLSRPNKRWSWKIHDSYSKSYSKSSVAGEPSEVITVSCCGSKFLNGKYSITKWGNWVRMDRGKTYEIRPWEAVLEDSATGEEVTRRAWFISRTDEGVEYNLDYYYTLMDTTNHSCPSATGWNVLIGQDPPPKLNFEFMFKPENLCFVIPEKNNEKKFHGRVLERVAGGYVVEISNSTIATFLPTYRLKPYIAPPLVVGSVVETKIKNGRWRNMWINCQVTVAHPNELYDVHVLDWRQYNVCPHAKNVPRKLLRVLKQTEGKRSKPKFEVGKYIETLIISGAHSGKWIGAMVTFTYMDKTYDIKVLSPARYKVSSRALSVPERLIREPKLNTITPH